MSEHVYRDAPGAWAQLRSIGGIETQGRDEDLEDRLRVALNPGAKTLDEALEQTTTDGLVYAFFGILQPYVEMFRAILDFFVAAGARQGKDAWRIRIENEHLELEHFQSFLAEIDSLPYDLDVPAVDFHGAWAVHHAAQETGNLPSPSEFQQRSGSDISLPGDVKEWLNAYRRGDYRPFPDSVDPRRIEPALRDAAAVAAAAVNIIRDTWSDREHMMQDRNARNLVRSNDDGFALGSIAQEETDFWLQSTIFYLSIYPSLAEMQRKKFAQALTDELSPYPRRKIGLRGSAESLERILELPVWKRRHELYAVWIATEIVNAATGHDCEIHHEDGRITFAFRETVVATFQTTYPTVRLYAERRSPLADPIGKGRKSNVQPDFGLWRGIDTLETCGVIVEVKHYKKDASGKFQEVISDYGRAHPKAKIVLVSHGPARPVDYKVPQAIDRRYHIIGLLTAGHLEQRQEFRELIRNYLGEPIRRDRRRSPGDYVAIDAVAIDVSISMSNVLGKDDFHALVQSLAPDNSAPLALIDSKIRGTFAVSDIAEAISRTSLGDSTSLSGPLSELLRKHHRVMVITDPDGLAGIKDMTVQHIQSTALGTIQVEVAIVSATG